jgi:hypothetical protein
MTPKDAEYFMPMKDGVTPQMFYKFKTVKFNDGTEKQILNYYSSYRIWTPSSLNNESLEIFMKKLVKI